MSRRLLLALALAWAPATLAQVPASPAATSLPATIQTTGEPAAFEAAVAARRLDLEKRITSIQATLSESRTTQIQGLEQALTAQVTSIEATLARLSQQAAARREIHATRLVVNRLQEELEQLRANGPAGSPPYPIDQLDALETEARAEVGRRAALVASASTSEKAREDAAAQIGPIRIRLTATRSALEANQDATRTPVLQALVEAAQADLTRAEEAFRFRDLDHQGDRLELESNALRATLLDEKMQWVRKDLVFRAEDLERLHLAQDKVLFDLRRALDATRLEAAAAERRWAALRTRLDTRGDVTELEELEIQTRFQELQAAQRESVLMEARLQRAETIKDLWSIRLEMRNLGEDVEAIRGLQKKVAETLEVLSREQHLQGSRLVDLRRERANIEAKLGTDKDLRSRLLRSQVAAMDRFLSAGRENLASIEAALALAQRAHEEVKARREELTRSTRWRQTLSLLAGLWTEHLRPIAWPLGKVLLILFLGIPLNVMMSRRVRDGVSKVYSPQTGMLVSKLVYYTGALVLLGFFLSVLGVGLGALVGAAGITGVALGFASQTSVSNIISGLFLIAEQPFQVGELITVGDVTGMVLSIDLISVKLRKFDNELVRIPNETILKSNLTNLSRHPIRRISLQIGVAYKEDLERVEEVLLEVAADHPDILENPAPAIYWMGYGTSGIDFKLNVWSVQANFWLVRSALFKQVKRRFDEEGIEIPFPHVSLYAGSASAPIDIRLRGGDLSATASPEGAGEPDPGAAGDAGPTGDGPPPRSEGGSTG